MHISSNARGVLALGAGYLSVLGLILAVAGLNELILVAWGHHGQMVAWPCAAISLILTMALTRRPLRRKAALATRLLVHGELTLSAMKRKPEPRPAVEG